MSFKKLNIWTGVSKVKKKKKERILREEYFDKMLDQQTKKYQRRKKVLLFRSSGMTLEAIGKKLGVSRERVRQIIVNKQFIRKKDFK
tara:strand:+ start:207 stop:467 length:261 start_codon:yes stop_codon:yes gene_type:complete